MHDSSAARAIRTATFMRIIAIEEAFLHTKRRELYPAPHVRLLDMLKENLTEVGPKRIRRTDSAGIDLQVLSHVQPGVQTLDRDIAVRLSREINDWLGEVVATYPTRFAGFAMLPTQAPDEAANELERSALQFGLKSTSIRPVLRRGS